MKGGIERRLLAVLGLAVATLAIAGVLLVQNSVRLRETGRLVDRTHEIIQTLRGIEGLLGDAEGATRGFAITGSEPYLEPYLKARDRIEVRLAHLWSLVVDDPDQQKRLQALAPLVRSQMAYRATLVETVRSQGTAAAQEIIQTTRGRSLAALRFRIEAMIDAENVLLAARRAESESRDRGAQVLGGLLALVTLSALGASYLLVRHHLAERQRAEGETASFFSLSLDMLVIASADGYFKRLSPAVSETLGWTVQEMLGQPFLEFVHPEDVEATLEAVAAQAERGESVYRFENRYRHRDGSFRTLAWRSVPGPSGLMFATARDVTEERRLEGLRAEIDRRFRALFESLPGLYLVLDADFRIQAVSDAYLKATMTTREGISGRDIFEVFPDNPNDPAASGASNLRASLERVRQRREVDTMPIQKYDIAGLDGAFEERHWSPINSPVLSSDGEIAYIIHRVEDVTEFVRQKGALSRPGSEDEAVRLERMQAEIFRSAEAARTANAQLKEANAEMEAFSYSVSHDLRAPLRHIQGYVEMLSRDAQGTLSEKSERFLRTIAEATTEMATLIDDLLSFSRMARMGMETSRVDLNSIADEVRRTVSAETPGRNLEWHLSETPEVMGDPSMLRQVLVNLFRNAVKYTRPRDPAVIEMKHVGLNAGRAVFVVSDNGVGFDPRYAHKLFGVFQRLHRAEEFEGTGIGLANVRRIIARHGGTTWAQGTLGEGASFYFTLPLSEGRDIEQGEGL